MRILKAIFLVSLCLWLGGALLTAEYGTQVKLLQMFAAGVTEHDKVMLDIRAVAINIFAPTTLVTGLMLAGAWLYRRSSMTAPAAAQEATSVQPPSSAAISQPQAARQPFDSSQLSCDFSGWHRKANRIVQQWDYRGQGLNHEVVAELTVEVRQVVRDLPPFVHRFACFWIVPANGFEGVGEVSLRDMDAGESSGWLKVNVVTATGATTLLHLDDKEGAAAVWKFFSGSRSLELAVRHAGDDVLKLPLPNNPNVQAIYQAIIDEQQG